MNVELSWDISDTGASIVQAAESALSEVKAFSEEHPVLLPLIVIGIVALVIITAEADAVAGIVTAIVTSAFAVFEEVGAAISWAIAFIYYSTK